MSSPRWRMTQHHVESTGHRGTEKWLTTGNHDSSQYLDNRGSPLLVRPGHSLTWKENLKRINRSSKDKLNWNKKNSLQHLNPYSVNWLKYFELLYLTHRFEYFWFCLCELGEKNNSGVFLISCPNITLQIRPYPPTSKFSEERKDLFLDNISCKSYQDNFTLNHRIKEKKNCRWKKYRVDSIVNLKCNLSMIIKAHDQ